VSGLRIGKTRTGQRLHVIRCEAGADYGPALCGEAVAYVDPALVSVDAVDLYALKDACHECSQSVGETGGP
jgi:hypothetical protein